MDENKDTSENINEVAADDENKSAISADLIRGHINTIILRTLYDRDKYGYEIIEEIEKKSHGQYSLKQPTLYSALKRLESQGYINAYWKTDEVSLGGRRKYYTLTDSGREITEKNQAEWEYSRTVIDNLISDRSFDFSQPAPTAVDFKILKKSTSRVPVVKDDEDDDDDESVEAETKDETSAEPTRTEIKPEAVTYTEQVVYYEAPIPTPVVQPVQQQQYVQPVVQPNQQQVVQPVEQQPAIQNNTFVDEKQQLNETPAVNEQPMSEEQRRIVHENYMRLISEPKEEPPKEVDVVPVADEIDTEKLIYNNKPETERDYRNLVNNLFEKTVKRSPKPENVVIQNQTQTYVEPTTPTVKKPESENVNTVIVVKDDVSLKADEDGLKVNASEYVISSRKKTYNRGSTLFKTSLIIAVILMLEFTFSLIFKSNLGVSLAYPFVIFAIAAAQLLIFAVLYYTDLGKTTRKPSSTIYLSACIIISIVLIFIVFIVSLLLKVDFTSAGDIFAKIIIPCIVALNIPIFGLCFYAFTKYN